MFTISLCMIVKNEERHLARCLDSLSGLMDEIIIVDTGSTDATKKIAARYTDRIYDFVWVDDFSAARNYAFSKATMDYIYSADADEVLLPEHRGDFVRLKEALLPEIEIVQMKYGNQLEQGCVYNFDEELRPKLYKRRRSFVWEDAIHEAVRLEPVVYDSDVVITHMPDSPSAARDLEYFRRLTDSGRPISNRLHHMYAMELYLSGGDEDFLGAYDFFAASSVDAARGQDEMMEATLIAARACCIRGDVDGLLKYSTRLIAMGGCSEIGILLGEYFEGRGDITEAVMWYEAARDGSEPILKAASHTSEPKEALTRLDMKR